MVPANMLLGVCFYGRAFGGVKNIDAPIGSEFDSNAVLPNNGRIDFSKLDIDFPPTLYPPQFDQKAQVYFAFNPKTQILVSFDNVESMGIKVKYAEGFGMAGLLSFFRVLRLQRNI